MKFTIRQTSSRRHVGVKVEEGGTTIDMGLLDDGDRAALAESLVSAIWELSPATQKGAEEWVAERFERAGVPLPARPDGGGA